MTHPRVSAEEAAVLVREQGHVYLDVRTPEEFGLGHPLGAYNIPWQLVSSAGLKANPAFIEQVRRHFDVETKFVVGCQTGSRSLAASAALIDAGWSHVVEQRAGYAGTRDAFGRKLEPGWQAVGLPTSMTAESGRSYAELQRTLDPA